MAHVAVESKPSQGLKTPASFPLAIIADWRHSTAYFTMRITYFVNIL